MSIHKRHVIIHGFGKTKGISLDDLARGLANAFRLGVTIGSGISVPRDAYDEGRGQYATAAFLSALGDLESSAGGGVTARLGITGVDLFIPRLNFVFGEADPDRGVAVVSLYRLRPDFYGEEPDIEMLRQRVLKEAIHELGHVLGLSHCDGRCCIMRFSNTIADTDFKGPGFCRECQVRLAARGIGREA